MSNCSPNDLNVNVNSTGAPNIVPGFGLSFSPKLDGYTTELDGYAPPDLSGIFNFIDFFVPTGSLKQPYNLKIDQSIFDAVVKYLDKAYPFLMFYKLLLPILEIILCVIEVVCAMPNPFKVVRAVRRLFRRCIPNFLSLFPIFALPLFLLSLLLLLLELIEYIAQQIVKAVDLLIKNILNLRNAWQRKDPVVYKSVLSKIAFLLCSIQNLFVVIALFKAIFGVIKDILSKAFGIPPCDDGNDDSCCSADVCPAFFKNKNIQGESGTVQYLSEIVQTLDLSGISAVIPTNTFSTKIRPSGIQFFDATLMQDKAFINIIRPYDLGYEKSFFPKGVTYSKDTPPESAPYTVDLKLSYDPKEFGRYDSLGKRYVKIIGCIVLKEPSDYLDMYDNSKSRMNPGVFYLTGGKVFEDDGKTPLQLGGSQATLDTLISKPSQSYNHQYTPQQDDAINYTGVSYTLNIRHDMLSMTHGMLTAGCTPEISADKAAVAATVRDTVTKQQDTLKILNDLPDLDRLLAEVGTALNSFRNNVSEDGAHLLRDSIIASLDKVKQETLKSIEKIVLSNFDRYKSKLSLDTDMQFTTLPIKVRLEVMDSNGQPMSSNLPASVGAEISKAMSAKTTLGSASAFQYDGSKYFYSDITSSNAGQGVVSAVFNSNVIANLDIPEDLSKSISVSTNSLTYSFIFASAVGGESGIDSTQRRDSSDIANDAGSSSDVGINIQGV